MLSATPTAGKHNNLVFQLNLQTNYKNQVFGGHAYVYLADLADLFSKSNRTINTIVIQITLVTEQRSYFTYIPQKNLKLNIFFSFNNL